jgi:[ribosomal protein S5]-alanine N-acetyltransferase
VRVAAGEVTLRPVRLRDGPTWSRLRLRDETYLRVWEPDGEGAWAERFATMVWPVMCSGLRATARRGQALPFAITVGGEFAGQLTLGNVVRGALCSAWVGYWVEANAAGGGVATAAVALAVDHAFGPVGLHRLQADIRPENRPSRRLVERLGFRQEGLLRRYLDIDGDWRDHLAYALLPEDAQGGVLARWRTRTPG